MLTRRQLLVGAAMSTTIGGAATLAGCSAGATAYADEVQSVWHPWKSPPADGLQLERELVRYATLAPSSHNTQCWRFEIAARRITIRPDFSRRCPAVDPDDHHLFVSLGCAAENLVQAARASGHDAEVRFDASDDAVRIALTPSSSVRSNLFEAIPRRQCTRGEYDGTALDGASLQRLEQSASGTGVALLLLTDRPGMEQVLEFVVQGNSAQLDDRAFVAELEHWIRFSYGEAASTRDGLFTACTGNPTAPRWLGSLLFGLFFTASSENDKYARQVRSSAGIAVFVSEESDKAHWVEVGRCYERFALQATSMDVRTAMLNQPVEVAALRPQFATALGLGRRRPDLIVRFGRGPELPRSLRRPIEAVLA